MKESPAPTVSTTVTARRGQGLLLAGAGDVHDRALAAARHDDDGRSELAPVAQTSSSASPGQSHSTSSSLSLTTSDEGDGALDERAGLLGPAHQRRPGVGVVGHRRAELAGRREERAHLAAAGLEDGRDAAGVDVAVCRQAGDRGHLPLEVEDVGRGARGVEGRVRDGREGRALGAGASASRRAQRHTASMRRPRSSVAIHVARSTGCSSAASPKATLAGLPPTCSLGHAARRGDGVDEGLADDERAGRARSRGRLSPRSSSVLPNHPGRSEAVLAVDGADRAAARAHDEGVGAAPTSLP